MTRKRLKQANSAIPANIAMLANTAIARECCYASKYCYANVPDQLMEIWLRVNCFV